MAIERSIMGATAADWGSRYDLIGSHIAYALESRDYPRAEAILARAQQELEEEQTWYRTKFLQVPLHELGVPTKTLNFLEEFFDAQTVGDVLQLSYFELVKKSQNRVLGPQMTVELFRTIALYSVRKAIELGAEQGDLPGQASA